MPGARISMSATLGCALCLLLTFYHSAAFIPNVSDDLLAEIAENYAEYRDNDRIKDVDGISTNSLRSRPDDKRDAVLREHSYIALGGTTNWNRPPSETNLTGGDIQATPGFNSDGRPTDLSSDGGRTKRKAINITFNVVEHWPNGVVPFRIDENNKFSNVASVRGRLRQAMQVIEDNSCIRFNEIPSSTNWPSDESLVIITDNKGACSSVIGRVPGQWQSTSLAMPCQLPGTIQHEMLHVLGFGHEHERPDRDKVIVVNTKYVDSRFSRNFAKEPSPTYTTDIPYDLGSVMHYSLNQFSISGGGNTLELKNPHLAINALDIGQRIKFSWMDELAVNQVYNCKKNCNLNCQNGGYIRKDGSTCKCICPAGLGGNLCERVQGCGGVVEVNVGQSRTVFSHSNWNGATRYTAGRKCYWLLKTSPGAILNLKFESFNVICNHNVEIRNYLITQHSIGLCGSTEPAPIDTRPSPTGNTMMIIMDTETGTTTGSGFKAVVTAIKDGCIGDPCHGAPCEPVSGSTTAYKCLFPDYNMHCDFEEGLLRKCNRVHYNAFYQTPTEYQLAFYSVKTSGDGAHVFAQTDYAPSFQQRGVISITPHALAGSRWCFHFKYKQSGDDSGLLNIYLAKNGQLNSRIFSQSATVKSTYDVRNVNINGVGISPTDMYEIVFEVIIRDVAQDIDKIQFDEFHLVRGQCPNGKCSTFPCRDADCFEVNDQAVCRYPEEDIHCDFESSENRCAGKVEYVGTLSTADSADWTINSGPTTTDNTGPAGAYAGVNYLYVESNFPPDTEQRSQREAYLRLSPRRAGDWCLSFRYNMDGATVSELQTRLRVESFERTGSDSRSSTSFVNLRTIRNQQGDEWHHFLEDVDTTRFNDDVKIQVEIIAKGRAKFSDIAIDDLHYVKGSCDSIAPVDGTWNNWSDYGSCSETCGQGIQSRTRVCTGRANNGRDCVGSSSETRNCIDRQCQGTWGLWSAYGECSASCGDGTQLRTRTCSIGETCPGSLRETRTCNSQGCPVDGTLSAWSVWGDCSVACGGGTQERTRTCDGVANGGNPCTGSLRETRSCNPQACPVDGTLSAWSLWGDCSVACGGGTQERTRTCNGVANGGNPCTGSLRETRSCNPQACPVDGRLSGWSQWSPCSANCGTGTRSRTRTCIPPQNGGSACPNEPLSESEGCSAPVTCPPSLTWGSWTAWSSSCSHSCGPDGRRSRERSCTGSGCSDPKEIQSSLCIDQPGCPVDGTLSAWGQWGDCSITCGGGTQERTRTCDGVANGGNPCTGSLRETKSCNSQACPVDGTLSAWSPWEDCSVACGGGTQERTRTCNGVANGGNPCTGSLRETRSCNPQVCPVDGRLSGWSQWSPCSANCGTGTRSKTRTCIPPQNGGSACPNEPLSESEECSASVTCPPSLTWGSWTAWSTSCSRSCGPDGRRSRERSCTGSGCSGPKEIQTSVCPNQRGCPVNGFYSSWGNWLACSKTCGGGEQRRVRACNEPQNGGLPCSGPSSETKRCNVHTCPVDGHWADWSDWSTCPVSCGGAAAERTRQCIEPTAGGKPCDGVRSEVTVCNGQACPAPTHGGWSLWTSWASCSVSCGTGTQSRQRTCNRPTPNHGGSPCRGSDVESQPCTKNCQRVDGFYRSWSGWTSCSATCGGGSRHRRRVCAPPENGGLPCFGDAEEIDQACNPQPCSGFGWSAWSNWGKCPTNSCPTPRRTRQTRTRTCHGSVQLQRVFCRRGSSFDQRICLPECGNDLNGGGQKPINGGWGAWGPYSDCKDNSDSNNDRTCRGVQTRTRNCTNPSPQNNGADCPGTDEMSKQCNCEVASPDGSPLCEGFEISDDIEDYGTQEEGATGAFSIASGPPENYFDGPPTHTHIGRTGPNWAPEGAQYLLFDSSKRGNQFTYVFNPYEYAGAGACLQFRYHAYGEGWLSGSVSLALFNDDGLSSPIWTHRNREHQHWQKVQLDISPQGNEDLQLAVVVRKRDSVEYQDFGMDDISIAPGTCDSQVDPVCPHERSTSPLTCGFEEGDDCSWLQRNVPGSKFAWTVWHGPHRTRRTGPSEPASGENYIYAEASGSRRIHTALFGFPTSSSRKFSGYPRGGGNFLARIFRFPFVHSNSQTQSGNTRLPSFSHSRRRVKRSSHSDKQAWLKFKLFTTKNQGCLEFSYHMYGRSMGTLSIYQSVGGVYPGQNRIFRQQGDKGNRWRAGKVNINFGNVPSSQTKEIIVEYRKGRGATGDAALDNIKYSEGLC